MESNFLKHITKGEEQFSGLKYYRDIFYASEEQGPDEIKSNSPLNNPDDDCPEQGDDETGYYSPAIYREEEEYYGSPLNQSEDDALILFTTSFIEEEVIRKCIHEISPDYLRSKEWELRWLAAKVRFRA
jgi:hypothetical protein